MVIFIKDMVCVRCIMAVRSVLETLDLPYQSIEMGRVVLKEELSEREKSNLVKALASYKLEMMDDKREILVNRVKTLLIDKLHSKDYDDGFKFSVFLSHALTYDYTYLANLFNEHEGSTIEKFYITQKIERVKELMIYDLKSITQISYELKYSSVAHLCKQFKKVTGLTLSQFKRNAELPDFIWRKA